MPANDPNQLAVIAVFFWIIKRDKLQIEAHNISLSKNSHIQSIS